MTLRETTRTPRERRSITSKLIMTALLCSFFIGTSDRAEAASQASVTLKVTISNNKSFNVDISTWNFSSMAANATSVSTNPIIVTNDSGGITETFQLQFSTPTVVPSGWQPGTAWDTTAAETFVLGAQFSDAQPADSDAAWSNDIVTTNLQTCTDTVFGNGTAAQSGAAVPANTGNTRNLWFRIETPAATAIPSEHSIFVTLSME